MAERQWYYYQDKQRNGPIPESRIRQMIADGILQKKSFIWTKGMKDWKHIGDAFPMTPLPSECPAPSAQVSPIKRRTLEFDASPVQFTQTRFNEGQKTSSYAGFWKRFAAFLIDFLVLVLPSFLVGIIFGFVYTALTGTAQGVRFVVQIIGILVWWIYYASFESSSKQATPGKMALGIKVSDLNGNRISFTKATGRHFGKIISSIILYFGFIMVAFTEKKQGLHDIMAGCLVGEK